MSLYPITLSSYMGNLPQNRYCLHSARLRFAAQEARKIQKTYQTQASYFAILLPYFFRDQKLTQKDNTLPSAPQLVASFTAWTKEKVHSLQYTANANVLMYAYQVLENQGLIFKQGKTNKLAKDLEISVSLEDTLNTLHAKEELTIPKTYQTQATYFATLLPFFFLDQKLTQKDTTLPSAKHLVASFTAWANKKVPSLQYTVNAKTLTYAYQVLENQGLVFKQGHVNKLAQDLPPND